MTQIGVFEFNSSRAMIEVIVEVIVGAMRVHRQLPLLLRRAITAQGNYRVVSMVKDLK